MTESTTNSSILSGTVPLAIPTLLFSQFVHLVVAWVPILRSASSTAQCGFVFIGALLDLGTLGYIGLRVCSF